MGPKSRGAGVHSGPRRGVRRQRRRFGLVAAEPGCSLSPVTEYPVPQMRNRKRDLCGAMLPHAFCGSMFPVRSWWQNAGTPTRLAGTCFLRRKHGTANREISGTDTTIGKTRKEKDGNPPPPAEPPASPRGLPKIKLPISLPSSAPARYDSGSAFRSGTRPAHGAGLQKGVLL